MRSIYTFLANAWFWLESWLSVFDTFIFHPFILVDMSSSIFEIKEHTVECQHIREYARATANSQEEVLQLSVKQYVPLDNPNPEAGDLTIIGAHANGFAKVSASYNPWI